VCESPDHWAKKCPNYKGRKSQPEQKTVNMVVSSSRGGTSGYGNLPYVFSVFQSTTWWLDSGANVHLCSDASLFSSYQVHMGCLDKVNVPIKKKCKLGPKTMDCVFLGYTHHSIVYRFLVIKSEILDVHVDTFLESRDVTFFENIFPMKKLYGMSSLLANMIADTSPEPSKIFDHSEHTPEPIHEEIDSEAPRRSKRPRTAKSFGDDFTVYLIDDTPKIIIKAFASPDADDWKEAVCSEMDSILSSGT
jgi:hypothetical protein